MQKKYLPYVAQSIVFFFFLLFIYFSYLTTSSFLTYHLISAQEFATKNVLDTKSNGYYSDSPEYIQCDNPNSYVHHNLGDKITNYQKIYSDEVQFADINFEEKIIKLDKLRKTTVQECKSYFEEKFQLYEDYEFKKAVIPHVIGMLFSLILFISFTIQGQLMYRKGRK